MHQSGESPIQVSGELFAADLDQTMSQMTGGSPMGLVLFPRSSSDGMQTGETILAPDGLELLARCNTCGTHFDRLIGAERLTVQQANVPLIEENWAEVNREVAAHRHTCRKTVPGLDAALGTALDKVLTQARTALVSGVGVHEVVYVALSPGKPFRLAVLPPEPFVGWDKPEERRAALVTRRARLRAIRRTYPDAVFVEVATAWTAPFSKTIRPSQHPKRKEVLSIYLATRTYSIQAFGDLTRARTGPAEIGPLTWSGVCSAGFLGITAAFVGT